MRFVFLIIVLLFFLATIAFLGFKVYQLQLQFADAEATTTPPASL